MARAEVATEARHPAELRAPRCLFQNLRERPRKVIVIPTRIGAKRNCVPLTARPLLTGPWVVEIADPEVMPFPTSNVLITHAELKDVVEELRYSAWRTALGCRAGHLPHRGQPAPGSSTWEAR